MRRFIAQAGTFVWGTWITVASHGNSVSYTITLRPLKEVTIKSRVRYLKGSSPGIEVTEEFLGEIGITTSDSRGNVEVSFMGIPTNCDVEVMIDP